MLGRLIFRVSSNCLLRTQLKVAKQAVKNVTNAEISLSPKAHTYSTLALTNVTSNGPKLLSNPRVQALANNIAPVPVRTVTKYSYKKGKRKCVKTVLKRFYRLSWGGWIHTKCGRQKKLWRKSPPRKRRLRQHVFCNATQSTLLDKMVTSYWRRPKYYVEDPYEPYHVRDEYSFASKSPRPYFPPDN